MHYIKRFITATVLILSAIVLTADNENKPIKALLITGGCCHDYFYQADRLTSGATARAHILWTVIHEGNRSTDYKSSIYDNPGWADDYDVIVHNECFAKASDDDWMRRVAESHKSSANSVVIHCAMHTYRDAINDEWRKFLGVTSYKHEHQSNKKVVNVQPDHPIMSGFPDTWTSPLDELYIIDKVWANTTVLAEGISDKKETAGTRHPAFWVNKYGDTKVFGTTFGHSNETFDDPIFIDTVTRGLLWVCGKLDKNGNPTPGYEPQKKKKKKKNNLPKMQ